MAFKVAPRVGVKAKMPASPSGLSIVVTVQSLDFHPQAVSASAHVSQPPKTRI